MRFRTHTHTTLELSKRKHSVQLQKQPLLHMHKPFTNNSILVIKTLGFWSKAFNAYLVASIISDNFHSLHCQWGWEDCYTVVEARYSSSSSSLSPPSLLFCNKKNSAWWFFCSHHLLAAHCITTDIINVQAADGTLSSSPPQTVLPSKPGSNTDDDGYECRIFHFTSPVLNF